MACKSPEHDADHSEADEGDGGLGVALEVPGEAATTADPRKGALDKPTLWQNLKALSGIVAFHNLKLPCSRTRHDESHFLAAIASVGEDALDEGE